MSDTMVSVAINTGRVIFINIVTFVYSMQPLYPGKKTFKRLGKQSRKRGAVMGQQNTKSCSILAHRMLTKLEAINKNQ